AVKIAPHYSGPAVHVLDASRSVGVCTNLLNEENKKAYTDKIREEYDSAREAHLSKRSDKKFVSIHEARRNRFQTDFMDYVPPKPAFIGTKILSDFPLTELEPYIDWNTFFYIWELCGSYSTILPANDVCVSATAI